MVYGQANNYYGQANNGLLNPVITNQQPQYNYLLPVQYGHPHLVPRHQVNNVYQPAQVQYAQRQVQCVQPAQYQYPQPVQQVRPAYQYHVRQAQQPVQYQYVNPVQYIQQPVYQQARYVQQYRPEQQIQQLQQDNYQYLDKQQQRQVLDEIYEDDYEPDDTNGNKYYLNGNIVRNMNGFFLKTVYGWKSIVKEDAMTILKNAYKNKNSSCYYSY